MLDKKQSALWDALGLGPQWVMRTELAELQKVLEQAAPAPEPVREAPEANFAPAPAPQAWAKPQADRRQAPKPAPVPQERSSSPSPAAAERTAPPRQRQVPPYQAPRPSPRATPYGEATRKIFGSRDVSMELAKDPQRLFRIQNADWDQLRREVADCRVCDIGRRRLNPVFGDGEPTRRLMIIGEAPGAQEDREGQAFVGPSGMLLNKIFDALNLKRPQDMAIVNTLKCRPPQNANPSEMETAACRPFLERQIELIDPEVIVAMGLPAAKWIFGRDERLSSLRLNVYNMSIAGRQRKVIVTYHPSYLLRTPIEKRKAWQDWCLILDTLNKSLQDTFADSPRSLNPSTFCIEGAGTADPIKKKLPPNLC